ncbi:CHAT domain-containing protein [Streptomyces sp. B1866]|uniref:CHAT domain-containing protein n=1 Tax=Streptomyces sp. B1866 TaxID=3075431 RepID=UPI00288C8EB7|nr:CHAT domain-containing protein [Streptomyces sp. B1866]MDT3399031.1 CHAT domain-containing protein [Streptomyces sp. B1866]
MDEPRGRSVGERRAGLGVRLRQPWWYGRAVALSKVAQDHADPVLMDKAAALFRRVAQTVPPDDPRHWGFLANLGTALAIRCQLWPDPAVLTEAEAVARQAVRATPAGAEEPDVPLSCLASVLRMRYEQQGDAAALDEAIEVYREAVAAGPADRPARWRDQSNLGEALRVRAERLGDPADVEQAVPLLREALEGMAREHPGEAGPVLNNLGCALLTRDKLLGDPAALDEAVDALRRAAAGDSGRRRGHTVNIDRDRAKYAANLGIALQDRYLLTGEAAALEEAVDLLRGVVEATPETHPLRAVRLCNLAIALSTRHENTRDPAALEEAVDVCRRAVAATPPDSPQQTAMVLLSTALFARHVHDDDPAALDEAIETGRRAATAVAHSRLVGAAVLANLANALRSRYDGTGDVAALEEAVETGRRALADAESPPVRAAVLAGLGEALRLRYEHGRRAREADGTVVVGTAAAGSGAVEAGGPPVADGRTAQDAEAPTEALALFREAALTEASPVYARILAAQGWAACAALTADWDTACAAYAVALDLVPRLAPRALVRRDREHRLTYLVGLATDAAACALHAGQPSRALEWLEQGRTVLLSQALDLRPDLTALRDRAPDLADRLTRLRAELDHSDVAAPAVSGVPLTALAEPRAEPSALVRRAGDRRRRATEEWDGLIREIHARGPELAGFLRPPRVSDLLSGTERGPVAVVNAGTYRGDALLLTPGGIRVVPLPRLVEAAVLEQVETFLSALDRSAAPGSGPAERDAAQRELRGVLAWLWDAIAEPVLTSLSLHTTPGPGEPWPRLWWAPTGLLGFLPLHAAGRDGGAAGAGSAASDADGPRAGTYGPRADGSGQRADADGRQTGAYGPPAVIDRVISSYTPTARTLHHHLARRAPDPAPGPRDPLVVAMRHTPGPVADLPGADVEAGLLLRRYPGATVLSGRAATHKAVLDALPAHPWVHFACHGASSMTTPSASHLLLHDHQRRPLTVADIARLDLRGAELAFLSACSTARASVRLTDEAIHLASALQLAGYRHVIATLWPILDKVAVGITDEFYAAVGGDPQGVAGALHGVVRGLRARFPGMPSVWASHIHVGV